MKSTSILIVTFLSLLFSISSYSQDTVKIPAPIAKQIARDLVSYDSTKAELGLAKQHISLLSSKIESFEKTVSTYQQKEVNYLNQINKYQAMNQVWKDEFNRVSSRYKQLKLKNTRIQIVCGAIIGGLTYMLIKK